MHPLHEATLDALKPLTGKRLLDDGCGNGLALRLAADRGAAVTGLDASAGLLDIACGRLPGADLRVGDIEALSFADGAFDAVTAFNSIQYAADPAAAVHELARVCRPGGTVAIGSWGDPACCESEALFARLRSLAPPPPGTPAPLAVSEPGVIESLLGKAGLLVTGGGEAAVPFEYADHNQAWEAQTSAGACGDAGAATRTPVPASAAAVQRLAAAAPARPRHRAPPGRGARPRRTGARRARPMGTTSTLIQTWATVPPS